jgi:hypothetical protein
MIPAMATGYAAGIIDTMLALLLANGFVCADIQAFSATLAKSFDETHLGFC